MCVCVCVYVYTYTSINTYIYMNIHTYIHTYIYIYTYLSISIYVTHLRAVSSSCPWSRPLRAIMMIISSSFLACQQQKDTSCWRLAYGCPHACSNGCGPGFSTYAGLTRVSWPANNKKTHRVGGWVRWVPRVLCPPPPRCQSGALCGSG